MLHDAISSVLGQTWEDFEILVSDNASVKDVRGVVESFKDARIRYHRHDRSIPMARNWQFSFLSPRTRYVATLQDDDYWAPDHLRFALECLQAEPAAVLYSCAIQHLDSTGLLELQQVPGYESLETPRTFQPPETFSIWLRRHSMQLSSTVFRRTALDNVHWGPRNTLFPLDSQIIAMAALKGLWIYDPRCTAFYRHHAQNLSSTTPRLGIKYVAQGNYVMRLVAEKAMELGCFDEEKLLHDIGQWPLAQRGGVVVALSARNSTPALKRFARKLLQTYPEILESDATSTHCRIAARVGGWYLGVADFVNRLRAGWWPVGRQTVPDFR